MCWRRENNGRLGKRHRFQSRGMDGTETCAEVPRTASRMGAVIGAWGLFRWVLGVAIVRSETQCVHEIAGAVSGADGRRRVEAGQCDPQQQSDRRKKLTEADVCSPANVAQSWYPPSRARRRCQGVAHRSGAGQPPKRRQSYLIASPLAIAFRVGTRSNEPATRSGKRAELNPKFVVNL